MSSFTSPPAKLGVYPGLIATGPIQLKLFEFYPDTTDPPLVLNDQNTFKFFSGNKGYTLSYYCTELFLFQINFTRFVQPVIAHSAADILAPSSSKFKLKPKRLNYLTNLNLAKNPG